MSPASLLSYAAFLLVLDEPSGGAPSSSAAAANEKAEPAPWFAPGPRIGVSPVAGALTILSERRSTITAGFALEGSYLFAPRPHLRIGIGTEWQKQWQLRERDRAGHMRWLAKLRLGGAWGRTFAYAHIGLGPSLWKRREQGVRHKSVRPAGSAGLGVAWAVAERTSVGLEGEAAASATSPDDLRLQWSARLTLTHRFGCSKTRQRTRK